MRRCSRGSGPGPAGRSAADLSRTLDPRGRQAEQWEVPPGARRRLVEQVGVEPGPELRRLHEAVLNQDASLELPARAGEGGVL